MLIRLASTFQSAPPSPFFPALLFFTIITLPQLFSWNLCQMENEVYQLLLGWRDGGWRGDHIRLDQYPTPPPMLARDYSLGRYLITL